MRKLVCLVGPSGSGKSTAGKLLQDKGFYYISPGQAVRKIQREIKEKFGYAYEFNELIAAIELSYSYGFNEFIGELLQACPHENIVLDSLINRRHIELIFQRADRVSLLGLNAPFYERVKRVAQRPQFAGMEWQKVEEIVTRIDQYEMSLGLGDVLLWCDYWIYTNGSEQEFYGQLLSYMERLPRADLEQKSSMMQSSFPDVRECNIHTETFQRYKETGK